MRVRFRKPAGSAREVAAALAAFNPLRDVPLPSKPRRPIYVKPLDDHDLNHRDDEDDDGGDGGNNEDEGEVNESAGAGAGAGTRAGAAADAAAGAGTGEVEGSAGTAQPATRAGPGEASPHIDPWLESGP